MRRLTGAITTDASGATSTGATYDVAGNLTRQPESGPMLVPTYDAANQRDPWTYDATGNLLSDGTTTYTYDALNRVTARATGGSTTTNTYNGDGVLLRQQTGATTTQYTQDLAAPLDQMLSDDSSTYVYGAERLLAQQGSTTTWYDADALGFGAPDAGRQRHADQQPDLVRSVGPGAERHGADLRLHRRVAPGQRGGRCPEIYRWHLPQVVQLRIA